MILPDLLTTAARQFPEEAAAIFPAGRISYASLDRKSGQIAERLRRVGIGPGARVAFLCENSLEALTAFWGVMKSGAASVDISTLAGEKTILEILKECSAMGIVISRQQLRRLTKHGVPSDLPRIILSEQFVEEICDVEEAHTPAHAIDERDTAMIIYTSGSTGRPKGVRLSHRNLISNLMSVNSLMGLTHEDSMLVAVPLHYIHGRLQLLTHTLIGGTLAFSAGFHLPQNVLAELVRHKVSGFSGVPYHFRMLLDRSALKTTPLPDLKYVIITGGAMTPAELDELSSVLQGVSIHVAYGQTEAGARITNLHPALLTTKHGSCGKPIPGVSVEVLDEDGVPVPEGAVGEVVVSGPNVMLGYVSGDEKDLGTIDAGGRLHTGDLGRMDAEGYLYLAGRKSEMIKVAGERILPGEIEEVLNAHPSVADSAVIGTDDNVLGEKIVAFVLPVPGASLTHVEVHSHCLRFLPYVRTPREVRIVNQLPKTSSGKLDRAALRSLLKVQAAHV